MRRFLKGVTRAGREEELENVSFLPTDAAHAVLLGRLDLGEGPTPVLVRDGRVIDVSGKAPTVSQLLNSGEDIAAVAGRDCGELSDFDLRFAWEGGDGRLLAPIDLQCIKAAGVTFSNSALERVIEEAARGAKDSAAAIRSRLSQRIGGEISQVRPGSEAAQRLKNELIKEGLWSQYLEVAIGPDAEVFTKAPVLSAIGWGGDVGVRADSNWNNPEPEVVLVCDRTGRARGAMLGNDVNLRDIEGRSALLLGKAKDNNASCALGPFIRLFDAHFTIDDVRRAKISLEIRGKDGFVLSEQSDMSRISRDPLELAGQVLSPDHHYPDGFALFMGTMFAPVQDRGEAGAGFTHHQGDIVTISTPTLGALVNRVVHCHEAPPWRSGIADLMMNLSARGLLSSQEPIASASQ
ncbi:MAG: fumarylacetoacetate hydrolase family protein [Hyphomonadaceae bacterium]